MDRTKHLDQLILFSRFISRLLNGKGRSQVTASAPVWDGSTASNTVLQCQTLLKLVLMMADNYVRTLSFF